MTNRRWPPTSSNRAASDNPSELPPARPVYIRLLFGLAVAALFWVTLPELPKDQTVVFALGPEARDVSQLEILWREVGSGHDGGVTYRFPSGAPREVRRQFRLADGDYEFRVTPVHRDRARRRPEVTRQVRLDGSTVVLRLED